MLFLKGEIRRLSHIESQLEHQITEECSLQSLQQTALSCLQSSVSGGSNINNNSAGGGGGTSTSPSAKIDSHTGGEDYIFALLSLPSFEASSSTLTPTTRQDQHQQQQPYQQQFTCSMSRLAVLCSPPSNIDPAVAQQVYTLPHLLTASRQNKHVYTKVKHLLERQRSTTTATPTKLSKGVEKLRKTAVFDFKSLEHLITTNNASKVAFTKKSYLATAFAKKEDEKKTHLLERLWSGVDDDSGGGGKVATSLSSKTSTTGNKKNTSSSKTKTKAPSNTTTLIGAIQRRKTHKVLNH